MWTSVYMVLEHTKALGHAHWTHLTHMVCMCVGASEVRPKTRAPKERGTIVEHQEESVAHNHEPRKSARIHARGDIAIPCIVLAK